MSKLSVTLLFIGLSLLVVWPGPSDGSVLSFSESSESSGSNKTDEQQQIMKKVREQCIKNTGSDDYFFLFQMSIIMAKKCIADFDTKKFKIDYGLLTNTTQGAFFSKYCPKGRTLASCLAGSLMFTEPCVKVAAYEMANVLLRTIPQALDLACRNDGEIVFKLKNEQRQECMAQKSDEISTCFNLIGNSAKRVFDFIDQTQEQCSILNKFKRCMKDILETCDLVEIVNVYEIPINAVLLLIPCGNQTEQQNDNLHENESIVEA